ncbi:acyl-CoA dehydrogenase family protein, partial [Chloroflexota bacterium]
SDMNFKWSEDEVAWRQEVGDFLRKEVTEELLGELKRKRSDHSQELYEKVARKGWLGVSLPREYGGLGKSMAYQAIFNEEMHVCGLPEGTLDAIRNTAQYVALALLSFGSEEQKQHWLPKIIRGEVRISLGLTEPNSGSDVASAQARAVEDNDSFTLNGTKLFSCAHVTTHMMVLARTDPTARKHEGLSLFLVDLSSPGVSIRPMITIGGRIRNEVSFEDIKIPKENLLGERNKGWTNLQAGLGQERSESRRVNIMRVLLGRLIEYTKNTRRDGVLLSEITSVRHALADVATEVEISWLLSQRVVWMQTKGMSTTSREAPMAKLYHTEAWERFATAALDIIGQRGILEHSAEWIPLDGAISEMYGDCRTHQIGAGTSEIQRNIIAIRGLGLPRK